MQLNRVNIVNFRSIKNLTLHFNPRCRILVGINESGKSNILKALSFLGEATPEKDDKRRELPNEKELVKEAYVRFVFKLDNVEVKHLYEILSKKVLAEDLDLPLVKKGKSKFSLSALCEIRNEGLYDVNFSDASTEKGYFYWSIPKEYEIYDNWKKPSAHCPGNYSVVFNGRDIYLSQCSLIDANIIPSGVPDAYLEPATSDYVNNLIGKETIKIVKAALPNCLFWQYDEKHLLPSTINLDSFASNPDSCVPLKSMFDLAGIKDIKAYIEEAKGRSGAQIKSYLQRIANLASEHFHAVWEEYKHISFDLTPNGPNITAYIKEKNFFEMAQRSDGFKRFISFLLLISAKVQSNTLTNSLLLIDEPDTSLHPKGIQYVKEELIRISKSNYVVYSTHSPFMIDRNKINRHILVSKQDEQTGIEDVTDSNVFDEEVVYNALGYSAFEIIKKKNIIFEGWRDKKIFQVASTKTGLIKKAFKDNVGICHAEGVNDIKRVSAMLELANRECLIVSDSDSPAKMQQKEYIKKNGYGVWKTYQEIYPNCTAITGEDFIDLDYLKKGVVEIKAKHTNISGDPIFGPNHHINAIDVWLSKQQLGAGDKKSVIEEFKEYIFENLKPSHLTEELYEFVKHLQGATNT